MKTCGDFGGRKLDGTPCSRSAGWGRDGSEGPCSTHSLTCLTPLVERFVDEYLVDLNGAAAYRRAGGSRTSAKQAAHELLKRDDVQAAIQNRRDELREEIGVRQQRVLQELVAIAFSDLRNVLSWGPNGVKLKSSRSLDDVAAAAVAEVRETSNGISVKLHSKGDAIDKLMKHLGMLVDRNVNFDIPWDSLPEEALERIRNGEDPFTVMVSLLQSPGNG